MSAFDKFTDIVPDLIEPVDVPFGEWLPDQATANNPGVLEALNVVPLDDGSYGPIPSFVYEGHSIKDTALGALAVPISATNVVEIFAGLFDGVVVKLGGGSFTYVHGQTVSRNSNWQFIPLKEIMIMLHRDVIPAEIALGTTTGIAFLGGSVPRAACGAMVGDFLFLGNILDDPDDGNSAVPNRIRWSGIKNINAPWVTDPVTQADYNDMPREGGAVVAIAGRTNVVIFQERKISFGRYVNLPAVWDIETAEEDVGCIARDSVIGVGAFKFFIAQDGFRVWNGTNTERIGDGKVDKYLFSKLQYAFRERICGAYDVKSNCVYWAIPTALDGSLNEIIIYNIATNRFSHCSQPVDFLLSSFISTISTDDLSGSTDISGYTDDPSYLTGGQPLLACFTQGHLYGTFSGENMIASLDTAEFSGPDNRRVFVNSVRPLVDINQPSISIQPFGRDQMEGGVLLAGTSVIQEIDGNCPVIAEAKFLRFRTIIPNGATWKHARGVQISRKATGKF